MFKFIESATTGFIRFQAVGLTIKSGHVVQLKTISDDLYVELSDGSRPFGFAGEVEDNWVKVYNQSMICRTDHFDKSIKYKGGDILYVKDGILTTNKINVNYMGVGHVISYVISKKPYIELNWL